MKTVAIVTATRAEYGLLFPVIQNLRCFEDDFFRAELIVTGTHLVEEYGHTIDEIRKDGIRIDHTISIPVSSDTRGEVTRNQATILSLFSKHFEDKSYDGIVLLGDRYETLAIALAAANQGIPIFHLYGGDVTEGAMDEYIRHSITKMSYLHFPTNEVSRKRIIQMGEEPCRVFNYGATGTDNILHLPLLPVKEVLESIGIDASEYALCTYHPVTMENGDIEKQVMDFLDALSFFSETEFIITKSNADCGGALINQILDREEKRRKNIHVYASLGVVRYLSIMRGAKAVIGNSSSGIMEAPVFKVPTVNIGDRQRGRLQAESTINCKADSQSIIQAIQMAFSTEYIERSKYVRNPYGEGNSGERIAKKIVETLSTQIDLKKHFYDIYSEE